MNYPIININHFTSNLNLNVVFKNMINFITSQIIHNAIDYEMFNYISIINKILQLIHTNTNENVIIFITSYIIHKLAIMIHKNHQTLQIPFFMKAKRFPSL